ncbi:N-methyl-L-tryptophan oxidase [Undibacter mobilis]|uniref:N-methyl-L-tryptophan oxidase n=1 Tax=Undibacter mobilis TaxID=2292256 RepID=A0A371B2S2_9BRAD|nr:N-methyl-L-tryptophan oxidase [Undibacter mobilis]RDV01807.1 N-methyl-L-tryptophan oxidase [Undibacter mobilis]
MAKHDVIVVGLGAVGAAATLHLARRGARVLGIDRFSPPHSHGSSHGDTRITRSAIGEGVEYSALALRSHALWREFEELTGQTLFVRNGCLTISGADAIAMHDVEDFFVNVETAARQYNIPTRTFDTPEAIRARYPQFAAQAGDRAILDEEAGLLYVERCIAAELDLAEKAGAQLLRDTRVMQIEPSAAGVEIVTGDNQRFTAERVLIAAGAWLPGFVAAELSRHFTVTRQVLHWFEIRSNPERFRPANCPVFIWQLPRRGDIASSIYGFPLEGEAGNGLKVTHEEDGHPTDPDHVDRTVDPALETERAYRTYIEPFLPDLGPRCVRTATCLYTRVPRSRFIIDADPRSDRITFASPCSGHGFKHSAALGEALADELSVGEARHVDLAPFRLARLGDYLRGS